MFLGLVDPDSDPSINKGKINKNLDFLLFGDFLMTFYL